MGIFDAFFSFISRGVFAAVDVNNDGKIEDTEVEVAILKMYNIVNKRLPGWQDPPSRRKIQEALAAFDSNKDGTLDPREFQRFAHNLVNTGPDAFFARIGKNAVVNVGVLPVSATVLKKLAKEFDIAGLAKVAGVPDVLLAPALGVLGKAVRGILPV